MRLSPTARLIVWLPKRADVKARSGDGSITIEHVNGRIELHTGDGSIRANDIAGELTLNTGDGSVTVDEAEDLVASVLRKLGVASRAQVASWVLQREEGHPAPS